MIFTPELIDCKLSLLKFPVIITSYFLSNLFFGNSNSLVTSPSEESINKIYTNPLRILDSKIENDVDEMIDHIKIYFSLVAITITALLLPGCRGEVIPTDNDMSSYGWNLYESGEYFDALDWFTTAIKEDSSHSDAYNGVGCF